MLPPGFRIGHVLFVVYLLLCWRFELLNTVNPHAMEATPWAGLNLAVIYGFGLILVAVVLALIYGLFTNDCEGQP
jgi:uncharacterized membrane protein (DUF485 family)